MLSKSRKSAFIMATIVLISLVINTILWTIVSLLLKGELNANLQAIDLNASDRLILFLGLPLFLLVFGILPGAYIIHGRDEAYFGLQGALRWAFFGVLSVILALSIRAALPDFDNGESFGGYFLQRVINVLVGLICAYIAFRVAFIGRHPSKNKESGEADLFSQ